MITLSKNILYFYLYVSKLKNLVLHLHDYTCFKPVIDSPQPCFKPAIRLPQTCFTLTEDLLKTCENLF